MPMSGRFVRFLAAGGIAAMVNFGSRIALSHWMTYAAAIVTAYLFGMITAFVLNRLFVFAEASNQLHQQAFWFAVINTLAVLQTLFVSLLFSDWLLPQFGITWHTEEIAHIVGIMTPMFTSYVGHKRLSFRLS